MTLARTWGQFQTPPPASRVQPSSRPVQMTPEQWAARGAPQGDGSESRNSWFRPDSAPLRHVFSLGNTMPQSGSESGESAYDPWMEAGFERINQHDPRFGQGVMRQTLGDGAGTMQEFIARPGTAAARLAELGAFKPADDGRGWVIDVDKMPRMANGQTMGQATPIEEFSLGNLHNRNSVFNDPNYGPTTHISNVRGNPYLGPILMTLATMGMGGLWGAVGGAAAANTGRLAMTGIQAARGLGSGRGISPTAGLSYLSRLWGAGG